MIALEQAFYRGLAPPPDVTVSQWADEYRVLSSEASAEPGRWMTSRAPFQREIMDAIHDPLVETVVVMSSAQVGKSEMILNLLGYCIDVDPGPILLVQPTLEMAEAFSKDRIDPMLRDTPVLRDKVREGKRDASNTIRHKAFPGGQLTLAGSNSPASLASRPVRMLYADEIDRWEVSSEGDPLALAEKRTTTFWNRKKLIVSTPTLKGASRIDAKFQESDQRRCYVACTHCGERHVLEWQRVKWPDGDPQSAYLVCPACGCELDEVDRELMLRDPEWRATAPFRGTAGFHIWEAYSPWLRLADIVSNFLEAKKAPDTLQVFVNTSLGETWEEQQGEQAEAHVLLARREPYAAAMPAGACCLTMGVDVQDDRLEALVLGWGPGEECWVIDARTFPGDPQRSEPWQDLEELLSSTFQHELGALLEVSATCIDTAGHRTPFAYDFARRNRHRKVYAVIGRSGENRDLVSAPAQKRSGKDPRKVELYTVAVDSIKSLIYSRFKVTEKGPGFVHFPLAHQLGHEFRFGIDEEFVAQMTAEKLVTERTQGVTTRRWKKMRTRNEALDMTVYAIAALRLLRPNLDEMAARLRPSDGPPEPTSQPTAKAPWIAPRRPGGWLRGGR